MTCDEIIDQKPRGESGSGNDEVIATPGTSSSFRSNRRRHDET